MRKSVKALANLLEAFLNTFWMHRLTDRWTEVIARPHFMHHAVIVTFPLWLQKLRHSSARLVSSDSTYNLLIKC